MSLQKGAGSTPEARQPWLEALRSPQAKRRRFSNPPTPNRRPQQPDAATGAATSAAGASPDHQVTLVTPFTPARNVDDEKRRRKLDRLAALSGRTSLVGQTPHSARRRRSMAPTQPMNAELRANYDLCIRLASQNKINQANAFCLHLIDHMGEVTQALRGDRPDFKLASSMLAAGAKIYCNRVESVRSEAQKVVAGMVERPVPKRKHRAKDGEEPEGATPAPNGEVVQQSRPKVKPKKKAKTLESAQALSVPRVETSIECDPIFIKLSREVDIASRENLLLNCLSIDRSGKVMINSTSGWADLNRGSCEVVDQVEESGEQQQFEMEVQPFLDALDDELRICPALDGFRFDRRLDELENLEAKFAFRHEPNEFTRNESCISSVGMGSSLGLGAFELDSCGVDGDADVDWNREPQEPVQKSMLQMIRANDLSQLRQMLNDKPGEYCYFDRKLMNTWAGPNFWSSRQASVGGLRRAVPVRRMPKPVHEKISFDESGHEITFGPRKKISLSYQTLRSWSDRDHLLPENFPLDRLEFLRPFEKEHFVRLRLASAVSGESTEQPEAPLPGQSFLSDQIPEQLGDAGASFDMNTSLQSTSSLMHSDPMIEPAQSSLHRIDPNRRLSGDNLVEQPYTVPQIELPYAKQVKRVNVRQLKGLILDLVQCPPATSANDAPAADPRSPNTLDSALEPAQSSVDEPQPDQSVRFSSLYTELGRRMSAKRAADISPQIAFVTLLHTASEQSLKLVGQDDYKDFQIVHPPQ